MKIFITNNVLKKLFDHAGSFHRKRSPSLPEGGIVLIAFAIDLDEAYSQKFATFKPLNKRDVAHQIPPSGREGDRLRWKEPA